MKTDASARILIVDDNVHGSFARKLILAEAGYEVDSALSGEEAWEKFQQQHFDIVVTDLRMTGMDGIELIRLIRSTESNTRVVLLSGFVNCLGMTEQSTGADEVICKSNTEVKELLRAVAKLSAGPAKRKPVSRAAALKTFRSNAG